MNNVAAVPDLDGALERFRIGPTVESAGALSELADEQYDNKKISSETRGHIQGLLFDSWILSISHHGLDRVAVRPGDPAVAYRGLRPGDRALK